MIISDEVFKMILGHRVTTNEISTKENIGVAISMGFPRLRRVSPACNETVWSLQTLEKEMANQSQKVLPGKSHG